MEVISRRQISFHTKITRMDFGKMEDLLSKTVKNDQCISGTCFAFLQQRDSNRHAQFF